jgi:hypothetical protein
MTILEIFLSIIIVVETVLLLMLMVAFSRLHRAFDEVTKIAEKSLCNNTEKTTLSLKINQKDLIDEIEKFKGLN